MNDRLALVDDNELRNLIAELDDALYVIHPAARAVVQAAADYLAALRERRHATQTKPKR